MPSPIINTRKRKMIEKKSNVERAIDPDCGS